MSRQVCSLLLALLAGSATASSLELANTRTYFLDYQISAEVEGCQAYLRQALDKKLIKTVSRRESAEAVYTVRIDLKNTTGLRKSLVWAGDVYSDEKRLLFSAEGKESGWTIQAACLDAADEIAAALGNEVRDARVNRSKLPMPKRQSPKPRPIVTHSGHKLTLPPPQDDIKVKAIRPQKVPESTEQVHWRPLAEQFARTRGCSDQLDHVQSLPTGVEKFMTQCGQSGEALITCAAGECILSF